MLMITLRERETVRQMISIKSLKDASLTKQHSVHANIFPMVMLEMDRPTHLLNLVSSSNLTRSTIGSQLQLILQNLVMKSIMKCQKNLRKKLPKLQTKIWFGSTALGDIQPIKKLSE